MTDYVSVSRACKIRNMSVKKVMTFLADKKVIPKEAQRKNKIFESDNGVKVISDGNSLKVNQDEFFKYLDTYAEADDLCYTDENMDLLDSVVNPKIRFQRIEDIRNKRLIFIDAEFKEGNYHEIAWEVFENGVLVESDYILERKHFLQKFNSPAEYKRLTRLKRYNQSFEVKTRKQINRILRKVLNGVDFIIAHNAYGERNALIKNGMKFEKTQFLCTSKMARNFVGKLSPALTDLVLHYKLQHHSHFFHYAHEDTRLAREVFFAMLDDAKERYNGED